MHVRGGGAVLYLVPLCVAPRRLRGCNRWRDVIDGPFHVRLHRAGPSARAGNGVDHWMGPGLAMD